VRRLSAYRAAGGAAAGGPAAGGPAAGGPAAGGPAAGGPAAGAAGGVADEPASARALAGHVARALDAGLLSVAELAAAGLRPGDAGR
jgi:hypothetical protein